MILNPTPHTEQHHSGGGPAHSVSVLKTRGNESITQCAMSPIPTINSNEWHSGVRPAHCVNAPKMSGNESIAQCVMILNRTKTFEECQFRDDQHNVWVPLKCIEINQSHRVRLTSNLPKKRVLRVYSVSSHRVWVRRSEQQNVDNRLKSRRKTLVKSL